MNKLIKEEEQKFINESRKFNEWFLFYLVDNDDKSVVIYCISL